MCQDTFDDNTTNTYLWNAFTVGSALVSETTNQLQVSASGGSWSQAGYVTKYAYDTQQLYGSSQKGFEAVIDVTNLSTLMEMDFMISDSKRTDIDPCGLNNWYRILKNNNGSTVTVQSRLGGGSVTNKANVSWVSSTKQLKIKADMGSIAFYENGILRYAEPYALPSTNCYIYAYTSSNQNGTGTFDNFYLKPAEGIFKDDFNDGNYNGWTVDSGSWSVSNGKLQSNQQDSHIHHNQAFSSPNRHVAADIQTVSSGGTAYVPFLMVNEINGSNMV